MLSMVDFKNWYIYVDVEVRNYGSSIECWFISFVRNKIIKLLIVT